MGRPANSCASQIIVNLDVEDKALLKQTMATEKLTLSDTVRRAVRFYAKSLGIEPIRQGKIA